MKAFTLVLLWLAGSAAAVGVAWSGVGVLDDDLVAPAPAVANIDGEVGLVSEAVTGADVAEPLDVESATVNSATATTDSTLPGAADSSVGTATSISASSSAASSSATATSTAASSATATSRSTRSTSNTANPSTTAVTAGSSSTTPSTTTTTRAPTTAATATTATTTASTATTSQPEPYETKTFTLKGGATAIRFSPSQTKVLWASPNPGYEVRIEPESPGVKVEFRSDEHRSRIDAWWENGPRHEIREKAD